MMDISVGEKGVSTGVDRFPAGTFRRRGEGQGERGVGRGASRLPAPVGLVHPPVPELAPQHRQARGTKVGSATAGHQVGIHGDGQAQVEQSQCGG
jgi:hypothetical protein